MKELTYYHNPRCSKSRQGLELLKEKGVEPTVKLYLKEPMTEKEVLEIFKKAKLSPLEGLVRTKEATFKELNLKDKTLTDKQWAKTIVENPVLLERPLLVSKDRAAVGRPPENLLQII
ncbi:arsenate reductase (glutaredoxin) [Halobacteriovorax sp. GB3]|uniref:arsenate reductase (glutaredoxin) n=1 Tax=Halobacteriovorax sp. GB3 TaxID=2719615 RepID=UPI00236313A7|nr:arsenate reductase (glutaredoxin) [Halobacteriovorax sp. GB3]MDD0852263.1 arsenate reductase (glutaredoxin) [Halobacteriovorax sp. GB3]